MGYKSYLRTYKSGAEPVMVTHYRVPNDRPFMPYWHDSGSRDWEDEPENTGIGEQWVEGDCCAPADRPRYNGRSPLPFIGDKPCSTEFRAQGQATYPETPAVEMFPSGFPKCCTKPTLDTAGGMMQGGSHLQGGAPQFVLADGGEMQGGADPSTTQNALGGELEGGADPQGLRPYVPGAEGEIEGGVNPQATGGLLISTGGEIEGGTTTAPQMGIGGELEGGTTATGTGFTSLGGEVEGGTSAVPQYGTGSEVEGGTSAVPQMGTGCEVEGEVCYQAEVLIQNSEGGEREGGVNPIEATVVTTYATGGTYTWTCPAGVTSVDVECWGSGGGGRGGGTGGAGGGKGGGGGAYSAATGIAVTPGVGYTVEVGIGTAGSAGVSTSAADPNTIAGNPSWFGTTGTVLATGAAVTTVPPNAGGQTAGCVGTVKWKGGGTGSVTVGGAGGGAGAGPTAQGGGGGGGSAPGGAGGTPPTGGGAGGHGGAQTTNASITNGSTPGGGGGGGGQHSGTGLPGANGADGQVRITYTI